MFYPVVLIFTYFFTSISQVIFHFSLISSQAKCQHVTFKYIVHKVSDGDFNSKISLYVRFIHTSISALSIHINAYFPFIWAVLLIPIWWMEWELSFRFFYSSVFIALQLLSLQFSYCILSLCYTKLNWWYYLLSLLI